MKIMRGLGEGFESMGQRKPLNACYLGLDQSDKEHKICKGHQHQDKMDT